MIFSSPSFLRASRKLPSLAPKCTPSAPNLSVNSRSSLIIRGTPYSRQITNNAAACSAASCLLAVLLRYCSTLMPALKAALTLLSSCSVLASSAVTAYRPLIFFDFIFFVACPEHTIWNILSHTWAECMLEGLPCVLLRLSQGFFHAQAMGDTGSDCRGERTARTMITARQALPVIGFNQFVFTIQCIGDALRTLMRAGNQHILATHCQQTLGAFIQRCIFSSFRIIIVKSQSARFQAIRCNQCRLREQQVYHRLLHFIIGQLIAAA